MRVKYCVLVTFFSFICLVSEITASSCSQEFAQLPKIFHINDTEECSDDQLYCKVHVRLKPKNLNEPPELWKLIQKQNEYKRDSIYRAFCTSYETFGEKLEQELFEYNLTGDVVNSYCYQKQNVTDAFGSLETFIGLFSMAYLGFMIFSTIKTYNNKNDVNKYQQMFSLINIWKEMNEPKKNDDFQNLLSVQGMRTLAMVFIVVVHSSSFSMIFLFIKNPEYYEDIPKNLVLSILYGSFGLVVQIYFIISAWLLVVQLHNIVRRNGKFTVKDLFILWLNRYFRLFPAIAVTLLFHSSNVVAILITHPYYYSVSLSEVARCKVSWWKNLLFLQNIYVQDNEICSLGMWYLAADMHLYIISSTFFYMSRRFKISMKYFFGLLAIMAASIQIYTVLTTDFDGILRFSPRLLPAEKVISRPEVTISYIQTYGNAGSYIIGFVFGTIYSFNKNKMIFATSTRKILAYVAFFGIPILASYLVTLRPNRVLEAILAVSMRPLFSFGIAIGLLAMVTGTKDFIKKFFESSPIVFLGNITYSTYMFHFVIVLGRILFRARYVELSDSYCFGMWMIDLISSFGLGMVVYIMLEHPCIKLQKSLIPQLKMEKKNMESKLQ